MENRKNTNLDDSGFDVHSIDENVRLLNRDGSLNIRYKHLVSWKNLNFYRFLIGLSNWRFALFMIVTYTIINSFFATLYYFIGLEGFEMKGALVTWWDAFFFSTHTLTTVGYGHIVPTNFWINIVASLESFAGLLSFSIATGLVYGRFTNSKAKIIFSENILIGPYESGQAMMLRLCNTTLATLSDLRAQLLMSWIERDEKGVLVRRYQSLVLEVSEINILTTSWTLIHTLNENSPFYGIQKSKPKGVEIMVYISAFDEVFDQYVKAKTSYLYTDIINSAKFAPMTEYQPDTAEVDIAKINEIIHL